MTEHDYEPIPGLPGLLPKDERIVRLRQATTEKIRVPGEVYPDYQTKVPYQDDRVAPVRERRDPAKKPDARQREKKKPEVKKRKDDPGKPIKQEPDKKQREKKQPPKKKGKEEQKKPAKQEQKDPKKKKKKG